MIPRRSLAYSSMTRRAWSKRDGLGVLASLPGVCWFVGRAHGPMVRRETEGPLR